MKSLYLLLLFIFFGCFSFAQTRAEEKLVNEVTLALKTQSDSNLYKCLPSLSDFRKLVEIQKAASDNEVPEAALIHRSISKAAIQTFRQTIDSGQREGIDWSSISIIKSELKEEVQEGEPIKKADIYITYKEKDYQFIIKLVDCIKINEEWKLMDRIWWY